MKKFDIICNKCGNRNILIRQNVLFCDECNANTLKDDVFDESEIPEYVQRDFDKLNKAIFNKYGIYFELDKKYTFYEGMEINYYIIPISESEDERRNIINQINIDMRDGIIDDIIELMLSPITPFIMRSYTL